MTVTPGVVVAAARQNAQAEFDRRFYRAVAYRSVVPAGLAIKSGGASPQFLTANTVYFAIDGVNCSKAAAAASSLAAATGAAALKNLPVLSKCFFIVVIDASGTIKVVQSAIVLVTAQDPDEPEIPDGYSVLGRIKISLANAAVFVPGTTNLDATDVTATYTDKSWVTTGISAVKFK